MKFRGAIVWIGVGLMISCGGGGSSPEPEVEAAPVEQAAAEPTPDEQIAALASECEAAMPAIEQRQAEQPLYDRLGGQEGIKTILTQMVEAHLENPEIAPLFDGVDIDAFVEHSTQFVSAGAGGAGADVEYNGRSVEEVHAGMNLTPALFLAAGKDLTKAMTQLEVGEAEQQEMMCALVSLRGLVLPAEGGA